MLAKKSINKIKGIVAIIMIMAMFIAMGSNNVVYAASATVTISSATVTQGQEVKVNIEINADANIGAYNFYLEYDANVLEAVSGFEGGGGGRIQVLYDVPDAASISNKHTKTITFKAIAPGTSEIKYVCINGDDGVIDYDTIDNMAVTANNGKITVNAPVVASKNNNLSSMSVAAVRADGSSYDVPLSPAFSKDVTKYNISVEEGVTKLVVAAKTEDAKSTIYVQWANLDPGENTTKVIVTAEDGSKKEYVIYTKVPVPETTTPEPEEPIVTVIDGVEYFVENVNDAVVLPEGFEVADYDYNGKKVVVGKGLVKDLILMYLTTGTGETGKLYIYDEVANSFYPMVNVAMSQKLYTIVKAPEGLVIPEGFNESLITIDGVEFLGWQTEEDEGIYLVYAMNWEGKSGLYYYDTSESQMIKYFNTSVEAGVALDSYNNLLSENENLKNEVAKLKANSNKSDSAEVQKYEYMVIISMSIVVVLIGVILALILKFKKDEMEAEEDSNDAMDIAFANIVSKEEAEAEEIAEDESETERPEVLPEASEENDEEDDEDDEDEEEIDEDFDGGYDEEDYDDEDYEEVVEEEIEETVEEAVEGVVEGVVEEAIEEAVEEATEENSEETDEDTSEEIQEELLAEETPEEDIDDISEALASELQSAVADIFAEEAVEETVEAAEDATEEVENTVEEAVEETIAPVVEETIAKEEQVETVNKKSEKTENKKRVEKILQDENTSIKEDELDMVIDELFDDLFGE